MISKQERINRLINTQRVVYIEDNTVHEVHSIEEIGGVIFVNTGRNLFLQDTEVMTLEEMANATREINFLKNKYRIL